MEKKYAEGFKGIITELQKKADKEIVSLEDLKSNKFLQTNLDSFYKYYSAESAYSGRFKSKKLKTFFKNLVMRAMLYDNMWDEGIADKFEIEFGDFEYWYSFQCHVSLFLNNEVEDEFKEYFFNRAKESFEVEKAKQDKYFNDLESIDEKSFLRTLLAKGKFERDTNKPRMAIESELYDGYTKLEALTKERDELHEIAEEEDWSVKKLKEEELKITNKIKRYIRSKRKAFDVLFQDKESNTNFIYIRGYGMNSLIVEKEEEIIRVGSERHACDLIREYVKWFNARFEQEILMAKGENKKLDDRNRYFADPEVQNKRQLKQAKIDRAIELSNEGKSGSEIARILGSSKSTVNDWLRKYKG